MLYLFIQTWGWILAAFILGLLVGWWLCCRCKCNNSRTSLTSATTAAATTTTAATMASTSAKKPAVTKAKVTKAKATKAPASAANVSDLNEASKPKGFSSAPTKVDELKRVKGIGPVIEKTLNDLGIYQFKQIAEFSRDNISWVEGYLSFPGRIDREKWVSQAKDLAAGKETKFSKRVDKGEMDY